MFKQYRKKALSEMIRSIESFAIERKLWGNNIHTAACTVSLLHKHWYSIENMTAKLDGNEKNTFIKTHFKDAQHLLDGLTRILLIYKAWYSGGTLQSIDFGDLTSDTKYDKNFKEFFKGISYTTYVFRVKSCLDQILDYSRKIDPSIQSLAQIRLHNVFNSIVIINEIMLENMVN